MIYGHVQMPSNSNQIRDQEAITETMKGPPLRINQYFHVIKIRTSTQPFTVTRESQDLLFPMHGAVKVFGQHFVSCLVQLSN